MKHILASAFLVITLSLASCSSSPGKDQAKEALPVQGIEAVPVLVNKTNELPEGYAPADLVYPGIPFLAPELTEKRMLRKEAAAAAERLFAGAGKDGIYLAGVSAYRSYETQRALFSRYAAEQGLETAMTFSAVPGTSEHETGLAIDVTKSNGSCPAEDCFAGTPEAEWLAANASHYGFIIRYPLGKEAITGYKYEPWHLRYVGVQAAAAIDEAGLTLEEYTEGLTARE